MGFEGGPVTPGTEGTILDMATVKGVCFVRREGRRSGMWTFSHSRMMIAPIVADAAMGTSVEEMLGWFPHYSAEQIQAALDLPAFVGEARWKAGAPSSGRQESKRAARADRRAALEAELKAEDPYEITPEEAAWMNAPLGPKVPCNHQYGELTCRECGAHFYQAQLPDSPPFGGNPTELQMAYMRGVRAGRHYAAMEAGRDPEVERLRKALRRYVEADSAVFGPGHTERSVEAAALLPNPVNEVVETYENSIAILEDLIARTVGTGSMRELMREAYRVGIQAITEAKELARAEAPAPTRDSEYETREDGERVRKDRWEITVRKIVGILWGARQGFEMKDVVERVRALATGGKTDYDPRLDVLGAAETICREAADSYNFAIDTVGRAACEHCANEIASFADTFRPQKVQ